MLPPVGSPLFGYDTEHQPMLLTLPGVLTHAHAADEPPVRLNASIPSPFALESRLAMAERGYVSVVQA
jgi:hypothetical protein